MVDKDKHKTNQSKTKLLLIPAPNKLSISPVKMKHQKSNSNTDEEFAFHSKEGNPMLESQLEHFMSNYDELIIDLKKNVNDEKMRKTNSDPKKIKKSSKVNLDKDGKKRKHQSASLNFDNINAESDNNKKIENTDVADIDSFVTQVDDNKIDIANLTSIEEIKDYYEYTENCLRLVAKLEAPDISVLEPMMLDLPEKIAKKKLAVFDLDETLIHCELKQPQKAEKLITITLPSKKKTRIGLNIRPHIVPALEEIVKHYHMIIFTASDQLYADSVLAHIDPMRSYFKYRLYRNNCVKMNTENGTIYVKDLRVIRNVPLSNMVIIDNSVLSFAFQLDNGIPILPFYSNKEDVEMNVLKNYLTKLSKYDDIRAQNAINVDLRRLLKEAIESSPEQKEEESEDVNESKEEEEKKQEISFGGVNGNLVQPQEKSDGKLISLQGIDGVPPGNSLTISNLEAQSLGNIMRKKSKIQSQLVEVLEKVKKFK